MNLSSEVRCLAINKSGVLKIAIIGLILSLVLSSFMGCSGKNETPEELSFFAMDTYMTLKVYRDGATKEEAWSALKLAKAEILRLEALLSVNDPSSEVAALNRGETVEKASADLVRILQLATELSEKRKAVGIGR